MKEHLNSLDWQQHHNNVAISVFENRNWFAMLLEVIIILNGQKLSVEHTLPARFD